MEGNKQDILNMIKECRFAMLPPRIHRQGEEKDEDRESAKGRYSVQCQICGRMGAMTLEEMKKHAESHKK